MKGRLGALPMALPVEVICSSTDSCVHYKFCEHAKPHNFDWNCAPSDKGHACYHDPCVTVEEYHKCR